MSSGRASWFLAEPDQLSRRTLPLLEIAVDSAETVEERGPPDYETRCAVKTMYQGIFLISLVTVNFI